MPDYDCETGIEAGFRIGGCNGSRVKVREHRERLRRHGLRVIDLGPGRACL
jgi:hypothetical protein